MCTVTWLREPGGYQLFCNRDEKLSRQPALFPAVSEREGVRFVAPRDGDFGGTWLAANEYGVTFCLLNGVGTAGPALRSRGLLVLDLLPSPTREEAARRLRKVCCSEFAPFSIAVLEPDQPVFLARWNGDHFVEDWFAEGLLPLTSSSFDTQMVIAERHREFRRRLDKASSVDGQWLSAFHASHHPEPGAASICMHREDAATVSFTRVAVRPAAVEMIYHPQSPCRPGVVEIRQLVRVG